ncbi:MAG: response regulator, partial [Spirochaetaceae bacterium]
RMQDSGPFLLGIFFALTLYHFFIWLGRRHALSNLAFSLLSTIYIIFFLLARNLSTSMHGIYFFYLFVVLITYALVFFAHTLGMMPGKSKHYHKISFIIVAAAGLAASAWKSADMESILPSIFLLAIAASNATINTIIVSIDFIRKKKYKSGLATVLFISFHLLALAVIVSGVLLRFLPNNNTEIGSTLIFLLPFLIMMVVFTWALTRQLSMEHRELELLKSSLEKKVEERTAELAKANAQKSQFFVNLAHEMKTPITLISNYFDEYVQRTGASFETGIVKYNLQKLKQDMIHFLDYEKLEHGKSFYDHHQNVNASYILELQSLLYRETAAKQEITVNLQSGKGIILHIDPAAFEKIINNIVDNALKYNRRKGWIEISLSCNETHASLVVRNTGETIPSNVREKIFEPYYQLSGRKGNRQGIGMGLAIVKKILDECNGEICVESESGVTTMTITLPLGSTPASNAMHAGFEDAILPHESADFQLLPEEYHENRKTIFLAEDNKAMLFYLHKHLGEEYNVYYAADGNEALGKMEIIPLPDIIISDIMMDNMDGFAFLERLGADERFASIPFIFLTA